MSKNSELCEKINDLFDKLEGLGILDYLDFVERWNFLTDTPTNEIRKGYMESARKLLADMEFLYFKLVNPV
jgi:hypothetical protein